MCTHSQILSFIHLTMAVTNFHLTKGGGCRIRIEKLFIHRIKLPGLNPVLLWNATVLSSSLTQCATTFAPNICVLISSTEGSIHGLVALLLIQLPAKTPRKVAENGPGTSGWSLYPSSSVWPSPECCSHFWSDSVDRRLLWFCVTPSL